MSWCWELTLFIIIPDFFLFSETVSVRLYFSPIFSSTCQEQEPHHPRESRPESYPFKSGLILVCHFLNKVNMSRIGGKRNLITDFYLELPFRVVGWK